MRGMKRLIMLIGKYVTFVDSDDILYPKAIESMYKEIIENDNDFVVCGWEDFKDNEITYKCKKVYKRLNSDETMKYFLNEKYFTTVIWGKLYNIEVIGKNRFDVNITIAEDFDFLYRVLKNVKNAVINTNYTVYKYRIRETSAMRANYNNKFENEIKLAENVLEDVKNNNSLLTADAIRRYQRINVSCMDKYFRENGNIHGVMHLKENLKRYKINLSIKSYLKMLLLLYGRPMLKAVYKAKKMM